MRTPLCAATATVLALAGATLVLPVHANAAPEPQKGADLFGHDKVWRFDLSLTAKEYAAMQPANVGFGFGPPPKRAEPKPGEPKRETHRGAFGTEFPWAEAALTADGKTIDKVGLRYKGNSTYLSTARGLKRSLKIDLDMFDEKARFHGLKGLTLNCGIMDATRAREPLAYSIYRAAGVPAPRTAFAEVTLTVPGKYDREHVGLYTLVENVDRNFLKQHFTKDGGLLMKPERLRGLEYLGDDWARYKDTYQPKREATKAESDRVIAFTRLVNLGTDVDFNQGIASFLDIDAFLKFMAVTAVVANLDSFFTLGHNYCLYLHPETKRFHFVPWDVDLSMGNIGWFGNADQQMDLSLTKPYSQSRLADRLMANKEIADRYQAILKDLMPRCFNKEKLLAEIDAIEKTVKPLMAAEQKSMSARKESSAPPAFGALPPPDMRKFLEKRSASIEAQLSGKSKGYVPVAFGAPPPPARPLPGDILPPNAQLQLQMTEAQKKELAELQKRVDADLEKILTPEQRLQLKRLREGGGTGGFGPPKMP